MNNCKDCKYLFFCNLVEKVVDDWEKENRGETFFYDQMLVRTITSKIRRKMCDRVKIEEKNID